MALWIDAVFHTKRLQIEGAKLGIRASRRTAPRDPMNPTLKAISISGALATLLAPTQQARAYTTLRDQPGVTSSGPVVWTSSPHVHVNLAAFRSEERAAVLDAVSRAATAWNRVACSNVVIEVVGSSAGAELGDGVSTIEWVRDWSARTGEGPTIVGSTQAEYLVSGVGSWEISESDILLNADDFQWATAPSLGHDGTQVRSVDAVIVHELGHLLGLGHSCDDVYAPDCVGNASLAEATMNPSYWGAGQATLSPDDVSGVCALYPSDCLDDSDCAGAELCVSGSCELSCMGLCDPGAECVEGSCVSPCDDCPGCDSSADCASGSYCLDSACVARRADGEPCVSDDECWLGSCSAGVCALECPSCERGCDAEGDCLAGGLFGDSCAAGVDCRSGWCAFHGDADRGTCTRSCDGSRVCPAAYRCDEIDGSSACVLAHSGCSASGAGDAFPILCVFGLLVLLRQRRLRT